MNQKSTLLSQKYWFLGLAAVIFIFVLEPVLDYDTQFFYLTVTTYAIVPAIMVAASLMLYVKHRPTKDQNLKNGFLMLAIGLSFWFWAEQVWNMYDYVLHEDPFPSYADFFYLGAYVFFFVFVLYYLKSIKNNIPKKAYAFGFGISIAFLFPTVMATYDFNMEEPSFAFTVALLYPLADSIILVPAVVGLLYSYKNRQHNFFTRMLIGFLFIFIADTLFLYIQIDESYYDGHPVDAIWLLAYVTFAFSIFRRMKFEKTQEYFGLKNKRTESFGFETINKFVIPLTIVTIITVVLMSLIYVDFYADTEKQTSNGVITFSTYGILAILAIFAGIVISINRNLSKIVKMRTKELEDQKTDLENLVDEKTIELIKKERLSAIGEFSARVAHDLRNPLASIKGATDLIRIKSKHPDDMVTPYFTVIEEGIDRMKHLVDDVLDYVRSSPLKTKEVKISEIIQSTLDRVRIPASIKIHVPKKDVTIQCDSDKMEVVFTNLLINAVQAVEKSGDVKITVKEIDDFVSIQFEDSGKGISDENMEKIFQPLFTTKQTGTGLGLSSCKNIVEQHGGTLIVKNNPTTFSVNLPKIIKIKN